MFEARTPRSLDVGVCQKYPGKTVTYLRDLTALVHVVKELDSCFKPIGAEE